MTQPHILGEAKFDGTGYWELGEIKGEGMEMSGGVAACLHTSTWRGLSEVQSHPPKPTLGFSVQQSFATPPGDCLSLPELCPVASHAKGYC